MRRVEHQWLRRLLAVAAFTGFVLPLAASAAVAAPAPTVSSERFVAHLDSDIPTELHREIAAGLRIVDAAIDGPKRTIHVAVNWDPGIATATGGPAGYMPTTDRGDGQPGCLPAALYEHRTGRDWKSSDPDAIDVTVRIRADLDYWRRYRADTSQGIYLEPMSKTIAHEVTHGLGIVSLGHAHSGDQLEFRSCTIAGRTVHDPLSELLTAADGRRLIDLAPREAYAAATSKVFFRSATLKAVIGGDLAVWAPNPFDAGSSLSHPTGTLPGDGLLSYPSDLQPRAVGRPSVGLLAAIGWQTRPLPSGAPDVWMTSSAGTRSVQWSPVSGANDYEIFMRPVAADGGRGGWTRHVTTATSLGLPGTGRYEVIVRGANGAGGGPTSAPMDTAAPHAATARPERLPDGLSRLSGQSRYETAASIATTGWPQGADTVLIATGTDFPDALAGAAVANVYGAPVLLTAPDRLPEVTRATLNKLNPSTAIVLGGSGAIADAVLAELRGIAGDVVRWSGPSRSATAAVIATQVYDTADTIYLATAGNFPDALAGAVAASKDRAPILLTGRDRLDGHTRATIAELGARRVVVLGGAAAVSEGVVADLRADGLAVVRLAGSSRYATAAAVSAATFPQGAGTVHLATGASFPDALAGAALAARQGPLLLVPPSGQLPEAVGRELSRLQVRTGKAFGGIGAVGTDVLTQIGPYLGNS